MGQYSPWPVLEEGSNHLHRTHSQDCCYPRHIYHLQPAGDTLDRHFLLLVDFVLNLFRLLARWQRAAIRCI